MFGGTPRPSSYYSVSRFRSNGVIWGGGCIKDNVVCSELCTENRGCEADESICRCGVKTN